MESTADGLKTYSRRRKRDTTTLMNEQIMINTWVWEHVLMHSDDCKLAQLLIEQIPVPESPYAKKMLSFKVLKFGGATEESLDTDLKALENLEILYKEEWKGKVPDNKRELFDTMQRMQILIRAEFALKHLRVDDREGYLSALEKHWSERTRDTEDTAMDDLSIDEFRKQVKEDLTAVVKRPNMRRFVLHEYKRERLEEGIKRFLELAKVDLGPSFLEKVAEDVLQGRYVPANPAANKRLLELASVAAGSGETNKRRKTLVFREEEQRAKDPLPGALQVANIKAALISSDEEDVDEPRPKAVQLLKSPNNAKLSQTKPKPRRMKHLWSKPEENALRAGVKKYGKGQWKRILMENLNAFSNRTEVDLKDKWRNIEKYPR